MDVYDNLLLLWMKVLIYILKMIMKIFMNLDILYIYGIFEK